MVNCLVMYDMVELIINYFNSLILNIADEMQFVRSMCLSVGPSVHPSVWLAAISTLTISFNLYKKVIKCE